LVKPNGVNDKHEATLTVPAAKTCLSAESAATAAPDGIGVHPAAIATTAAAANVTTAFESDRVDFIGNLLVSVVVRQRV
jgi:hypothetical protein